MLNWDEDSISQDEEFLLGDGEEGHNQEVKFCMLNDPDCEACQ